MLARSKLRSFLLIATVCLLETLVGAEIDLFTPSFPEMQSLFGLEPYMVELTLSLNLVTQCLVSVVMGDWGDRWDRKKLIVGGMVLFVLGSILCVGATSFSTLLLGRVLQGMGIAGPSVLAYVVIADLYSPAQQMKIMAAMNGFINLSIALGPVVGSYVALLFHWRGNFFILLVLGVISLLASWFFIPSKTMTPHASSSLSAEYGRVLKSSRFWFFMGPLLPCALSFFVFVGVAPILYMEGLGVPLESFGFYQGALCFVFAMGSFLAPWTLRKWGVTKMYKGGLLSGALFCAGTVGILVFQVTSPLAITGIMLFEVVAAIYPVLILWPLFLEAVPGAKGKTTALFNVIRMGMTALSIEAVTYVYDGTYLSLGTFVLITCSTMVIFGWRLGRLEKLEALKP